MKPLSYRLLNDQTPVTFILTAIEISTAFPTRVIVKEANVDNDELFSGDVQVIGDRKPEGLLEEVKTYNDFMAMKEEEQKKFSMKPVLPTVEIARVQHSDFPYMK